MKGLLMLVMLSGSARAQDGGTHELTRDEMIEAINQEPKLMTVALSTGLCAMSAFRANALAEIAKEKKYARIGGYENKAKLYALQQLIRKADEKTGELRADIKTWKGEVKVLPCTHKAVKKLMACHTAAPGSDQIAKCKDGMDLVDAFVPKDPDPNDDE